MSETIYLHPQDAWIDRDGDGINEGMAILRDEEATEMGRFPGDWTDEQIKLALNFANRFYAKGVEMGKWYKVRQVKSVLEIIDPPRSQEES